MRNCSARSSTSAAWPAWKCSSLRSQSRNSLARRIASEVVLAQHAALVQVAGIGRAVADKADPAEQLQVAQRARASV